MQRLILVLFSILLVFVSYDIYLADELTIKLNSIFIYKGFGINSLNIYNILLLLLLIFSYLKYKPILRKLSGFQLIFSHFTLLCLFLNVINPYNNEIRLTFFSIDQYIILFIVLLFILLDEGQFFDFAKSIFNTISIILILRAIILLALWSVGKGQKGFYGVNASVSESDTLGTYFMFQSVHFILYLVYRKPKYLLVWSLFFLIQIFSYRRTNLINSVIFSCVMYVVFTLFCKPNANKILNITIVILAIVVFSIPIYSNLSIKEKVWVDRYLSVIPGFESNIKGKGLNDSGHWEQTATTTNQILSGNFKFWGIGEGNMGKKRLQGQTVAVHNIFASSWFYYGFHYFIYVLFIYGTSLFLFFKYFFNIIVLKHYDNLTFFKFGISLIMLLYLAGMFFAMLWFFSHHRIGLFWMIILFFLIKIKDISFFNTEKNESIVVY